MKNSFGLLDWSTKKTDHVGPVSRADSMMFNDVQRCLWSFADAIHAQFIIRRHRQALAKTGSERPHRMASTPAMRTGHDPRESPVVVRLGRRPTQRPGQHVKMLSPGHRIDDPGDRTRLGPHAVGTRILRRNRANRTRRLDRHRGESEGSSPSPGLVPTMPGRRAIN